MNPTQGKIRVAGRVVHDLGVARIELDGADPARGLHRQTQHEVAVDVGAGRGKLVLRDRFDHEVWLPQSPAIFGDLEGRRFSVALRRPGIQPLGELSELRASQPAFVAALVLVGLIAAPALAADDSDEIGFVAADPILALVADEQVKVEINIGPSLLGILAAGFEEAEPELREMITGLKAACDLNPITLNNAD